jgi:hypothetical protein
MKVKVQSTLQELYHNDHHDQLIEHVVGPVAYYIYCTDTGVSVHTGEADDLDDGCWECQMNLGFHGNASTSPAVDISVERTDR